MIYCSFSRYGFDDMKRMNSFSAITGWEYESAVVADRIYTLERLFNLREGITRKDDSLSWRSFREPMLDRPSKGNTISLEPMLDD